MFTMLLFNPNQLDKVKRQIQANVLMFIAQNIGLYAITDADKELLKNQGFDLDKVSEAELPILALAYKFGMYSVATSPTKMNALTLYDFTKIVRSNKFLPLSVKERAALESVQSDATNQVKQFGDKTYNRIYTTISEIDKAKKERLEATIGKKTEQAIIKRQSVKELASDLRKETDDIARDFIRVANYNLHTAFDYGRAKEVERLYGNDALVYKYVYGGSCEHCQRLYTEGGVGSKPKVFKLSELKANGTNIGRKVRDWRAVVGSTHPYCRCTLTDIPPYYQWDEESGAFVAKFDSEHNKDVIAQYQAKLKAAKDKRGDYAEMQRKLNDALLIKGDFADIANKQVKQALQKTIIKSQYKVVNEYENEYNSNFSRLVNNILVDSLKTLNE